MFLHPRLRRQAIMLLLAFIAVIAAKLYLNRIAEGRETFIEATSEEPIHEPQTVETVPPPPATSTTASSP